MSVLTVAAARDIPVVADGRSVVRRDIQGLRALAVTLVLAYHLWPDRLTGGYVGVDVFFVISGFLITAHLLARPPRTLPDLLGFWSRRARRLLPASLLVLAVTVVMSRAVAPETQWGPTARQAGGAVLYLVNWQLAADSVDYLAADDAATPVQHFWSLAVEEQFYLVWPVLIGLLGILAVRRRWAPMRMVVAGLGLVVALSLAYSVQTTAVTPGRAYFLTPARAWEFGAGGLLAAALRLPPAGRASWGVGWSRARPVLAVAGLAAVLLSAFTYDAATPFPGWTAVLPVAGTVALIAARAEGTAAVDQLLGHPAAQWLGDRSYSIYLWHWPLVVLLPQLGEDDPGLLGDLNVVLATLLLGTLSKRFVEDPVRRARWAATPRQVFGWTAAAMAALLLLVGAQALEVRHRQTLAEREAERALAAGGSCFGAAALDDPESCAEEQADTVVPAPAQAVRDKAKVYPDVPGGRACLANAPDFPVLTCTFGDPDATVSVALVGNSHAAQWLPALEQMAAYRGWRITTHVASRCAVTDTDLRVGTPAETAACRRWGAEVSQRVMTGGYDLVVLSNRMSSGAVGSTTLAESVAGYRRGYESLLRRWAAARVRVVAIRDTPASGNVGLLSVPDCVAEHADQPGACDGRRSAWEPAEPLVDAVRTSGGPRTTLVDLNDRICLPDTCSAVVGGVLVYYDDSHLTATYSRTLAPYLDRRLVSALRS